MQIYREWEISFWNEYGNYITDSGVDNITLLEDKSPHFFYLQLEGKYTGPYDVKLTLRREDGSVEESPYTFSVAREYPGNFIPLTELRAQFAAANDNYIEILKNIRNSRKSSIRDMMIAVWMIFDPEHNIVGMKYITFIKDWINQKISDGDAELKLKAMAAWETWQILAKVRQAFESGIPPSTFISEYKDKGTLFLMKLLKDEFNINRHLGELAALVNDPDQLDRIFSNLKHNSMSTTIYHNQNCSKSCAMVDKLRELNVEFDVVGYMEDRLIPQKLEQIIRMLGIRPEELVRKNEAIYLEKFSGKNLTDQEWIEAMTEFPELIERPVVVHGNKAAIGRPVQKVVDLFFSK